MKVRILGKISKKCLEESLVAINISQKPKREFLKGTFFGRKLFKKNRAESQMAPPSEILPKNG